MVSMTSGSYTLRSSDIMSDYVKLKLLAESFLVTLNSQYELSEFIRLNEGIASILGVEPQSLGIDEMEYVYDEVF